MWNRIIRYLTPGLDAHHPGHQGQPPFKMMDPPSREDVYQAFRLILGREPGNESAVEAHLKARNVAALRLALLNSEEFQGKFRSLHPDNGLNPYWLADRETLIFVHLKKTGGNSLRAMLQRHFTPDRICPMRDNNLHCYSVAELAQFDLFAGHFDLQSVNYIPRHLVKTVSLFREPTSRLISFYRFARAHPPRDEFAHNATIRLANELTAEEFFERQEIRSISEIYNHYLMALGLTCSWFDHNGAYPTPSLLSRGLENAKTGIRNMTAIGITEQFSDSVEYICHACNLPSEPSLDAVHVTDHLSTNDDRFRRVDPVQMTPRLAAALEDLTKYDVEIYHFAVDEFRRRFNEFKQARPR